MESIEISAKSEEEAVDIALAELGLSRSEIKVEVVKKGRSGLFGLGSGEVRVRVTPIQPLSDEEIGTGAKASEVLETLLSHMGIQANINLETRGFGEQAATALDIVGEDLGILIGRRGETLSTLQYLVNLIVSRHFKSRVGVLVDVEGYRRRRHESLRLLALRLADQVKNTGRSVTLEPMPAGERRIIHLELRDHPHVTTQSIGQGDGRKVTILAKGNNRN
ncbi:MAG: Jag N-terminal domain-containing protein [Dehalococcoidia bacterium]|jgi:spoIIIJ-associated protein|nr:Jag N-terminal domain-containing protein [Dehalococcoidia bacterium]